MAAIRDLSRDGKAPEAPRAEPVPEPEVSAAERAGPAVPGGDGKAGGKPGEQPASRLTSESAASLVRLLGVCLQNVALYGPSHAAVQGSIDGCYEHIKAVLESAGGELVISTGDNAPIINGVSVPLPAPHAKTIVRTLLDRDVGSFSLMAGIARNEFAALVEVLTAKAADLEKLGGFEAVLESLAIKAVKAAASTYVRVSAGEDRGTGGGTGPGGGGKEGAGPGEEGGAGRPPEDDADCLGFLRGDPRADAAAAAERIRSAGEDPAALGAAITRAVQAAHAAIEFRDGRTRAALAADALQKTMTALRQSPSAATLKGRGMLLRTLSALEEQILAWLRSRAEEGGAGDEAAVSEAVAAIRDDIEIESLVEDYLKKRSAVEANETRILRYMKTRGADGGNLSGLEKRLVSSGLTISAWHELMIKSGVGDAETGGGVSAVDRLATLLEEVRQAAGGGEGDAAGADRISAVLDGIGKELARVVERTERKIAGLKQEIEEADEAEKAGDASAAGGVAKLSRKRLMTLLSEIVQELYQPLTVVMCVVDGMRGEAFGKMTPQQIELLTTACEGGLRLDHLVKKLADICGYPVSLSPDADVLAHIS